MLFGEIPHDFECVIAPFAIDLSTEVNDGRIYYRQTNDTAILRRAKRDVRLNFSGASTFNPDWVFIASYNDVTYYTGSSTSPVSLLI